MASGDIYEVKLAAQHRGQNFLNVFLYRQTTDSGGDAGNLAELIKTDLVPAMIQVQSSDTQYITATVVNLDNISDFWTEIISDIGTLSGDAMPSHDAWSFIYLSSKQLRRSGGKRVGGLTEATQTAGLPTALMLISLTLLAVMFEATLADGGNAWQPVLKQQTTPRGFVPKAYEYNTISGVDFVELSTQNTRKRRTSPGL